MEEEIIEKDMTPVLLVDLGMRYPTEESKERKRYGLYQCQYCGKDFEVQCRSIKSGHTTSCGCLRLMKPNSLIHGFREHRLYYTWSSMLKRCYNEKSQKYKDYGGRGIKVCDRWMDVANFIEDMYPSFEEGFSLDRIDVDGDYELVNCRWSDKYVQSQNTRDIICTNTSGYRGVSWREDNHKWRSYITVNNKRVYLGYYQTALEAAKAYERYVRLHSLEHNFTPALTPEEIKELETNKETQQ